MLIYNFQKEFIGIDEEDLKALGYANLAELRAEAADFADLFVKTPGHIHNFKHVHWIDFIDCADSTTPTKAIIHAKDNNYKCLLSIKPIYLTDHPASRAYTVYLDQLVKLGDNEIQSIADDISSLSIADKIEPELTALEPKTQPQTTFEIEEKPQFHEEPVAIAEVEDEPLDIVFDIDDELEETPEPATPVVLQPKPQETIPEPAVELEPLPDYTYNPEVASAELGLPIDLIEEFVEDFIAQAKEFKNELYKALSEHDMDNIKSLSHKLKGVAANLHIDDAFETLVIINTTDKFDEIASQLDIFYRIIAKLANEENIVNSVSVEKTAEIQIREEDVKEDEDIYQNLLLDEMPQQKHPTIEYNPKEVADDIGLDTDTFNELLADYITESIAAIEDIKHSISVGDFQKIKAISMQLKGMSQNMRVDSVVTLLDELITTDDSFKAESTLNNLDALISQISILKA